MKIVLITISSTGNTAYAAHSIGSDLSTKYNHEVSHIDGLELIKQLHLGNRQNPDLPSSESIEECGALTAARDLISEADVVGLGAYATMLKPQPGYGDLFSETILPQSLFSKARYYFVYFTQGGKGGKMDRILATTLSKKCTSAQFTGALKLITPDSTPLWQPEKPFRDPWQETEVAKIHTFSDSLNTIFVGLTTTLPAVPAALEYNGTKSHASFAKRIKAPVVDRTLCVKCGRCVRECPYNAIAITGDIEDGFPIFNAQACWSCARCFHHCPQDALNYGMGKTQLRSRMKKPIVPGLSADTDGSYQNAVAPESIPRDVQLTTSKPHPCRTCHRIFVGNRCCEVTLYVVPTLVVIGLIVMILLLVLL
ncbi:hypothetical protein BLNAU_7849 [Blattamonas nauphoetae]|uniref:4Fe-4S ferredoxin-type domain-containing protein n=1 Tax=Blattamonas nauphoetae TaxID=2049346 RepID=A0ABQ9Y0J8_9EUKA|nr:hypothetical protein BLNAU_7849 [Blattamonas nauphoetae]